MLAKLIRKLAWFFAGRCPNCGGELDNDAHGYERKWSHCHDCGYCTQAKQFGRERCGIDNGK